MHVIKNEQEYKKFKLTALYRFNWFLLISKIVT
jgi:hypothetical protein